MQTPSGFLFELTGGRPCLDLANTVDNRPSEAPRENLNRYEDLVAWCEQSCQITPKEGSDLRRAAREHPRRAETELRRARTLREALFALFSAAAAGRALPERDLETLNGHLPAALGRLRVGIDRDGPAWHWKAAKGDLDRLLPPVIDDAADLLTSPLLSRVRECNAGKCSWLFLDQSHGRTRKWCDMRVCGNRAKALRHYRRSRAGS
jgi:predicted RNA-binding Zn ribbon-like protein